MIDNDETIGPGEFQKYKKSFQQVYDALPFLHRIFDVLMLTSLLMMKFAIYYKIFQNLSPILGRDSYFCLICLI